MLSDLRRTSRTWFLGIYEDLALSLLSVLSGLRLELGPLGICVGLKDQLVLLCQQCIIFQFLGWLSGHCQKSGSRRLSLQVCSLDERIGMAGMSVLTVIQATSIASEFDTSNNGGLP